MPAPAATTITVGSYLELSGVASIAPQWFKFTLAADSQIEFITTVGWGSAWKLLFDADGTPFWGYGRDNITPAVEYYLLIMGDEYTVEAAPFIAIRSNAPYGVPGGPSKPWTLEITCRTAPVYSGGAIHVRDDFGGAAGPLSWTSPNIQEGVANVIWVGQLEQNVTTADLLDGSGLMTPSVFIGF